MVNIFCFIKGGFKMNFMEAYDRNQQIMNNLTFTENGANAFKSTTSAVLDLFEKAK